MNKQTRWYYIICPILRSTEIILELTQTHGAERHLRTPQYTRLPYLWHKISGTKYSYQYE
jgi:hypothetical protein